jgi:AcrR family transcriptional regulator
LVETGTDLKSSDKRRRIQEAAWQLVLRHGLRGMTMEALAREAGIAKATLYAQFPDKDAVIAGVIDDMLIDLRATFDAGMKGSGEIADKIGAALAGKYRLIFRALEGSPHAQEILSEHHRYAARFAAFDQKVEADIEEALAEAGASDAPRLARIIIGAAGGIAQKMSGAEAIDGAIRLMCRRLIAPEVNGA